MLKILPQSLFVYFLMYALEHKLFACPGYTAEIVEYATSFPMFESKQNFRIIIHVI